MTKLAQPHLVVRTTVHLRQDATHVRAAGSLICCSVIVHSLCANCSSCACLLGFAILQSAKYAPDLPLSSGEVAAYTDVAAPCAKQVDCLSSAECKADLCHHYCATQQTSHATCNLFIAQQNGIHTMQFKLTQQNCCSMPLHLHIPHALSLE